MTIHQMTGVALASVTERDSQGGKSESAEDASGQLVKIVAEERRDVETLSISESGRELTTEWQVIGTLHCPVAENVLPKYGDEHPRNPEFTVSSVEIERRATGGTNQEQGCFAIVKYVAPIKGSEITDPEKNASSGGSGGGGGGTNRKQVAVSHGVSSQTERKTEAISQEIWFDSGVGDKRTELTVGKQPDGRIEGVDVEVPVFTYSETWRFSESAFNAAFRKTLRDSLKKVNNAAWKEYEAGEVMFDNFATNKEGKSWVVRFDFLIRRNESATFTIYPTVGAAGVNLTKDVKGWHYAWLVYSRQETDQRVTETPIELGIAQVYDEIDFAVLGITTEVMP